MIEGHTDAVGSDAANLQLSRERALAVKEALSTYYVIPPENLKTVGFGEKYLKIPTEEARPRTAASRSPGSRPWWQGRTEAGNTLKLATDVGRRYTAAHSIFSYVERKRN